MTAIKMRMGIRGQPTRRGALQMAVDQADLELACANVDLLMGLCGRSHVDDFGHGIFDPSSDPEFLAVQNRIDRIDAHRVRMIGLLMQCQETTHD